jgi:hypothetical protein
LAQKLRHRKKKLLASGRGGEMIREVIYQEVNKSRLTDHFNKIPGERGKVIICKQSILRHLFLLFMFIPFLTVIFINKGELTE